ncbi:hypothetical protein IFM89_038659 [Coptis chinensis]|uniref:Uncharacterized protein n=1 Tax=Coptis chinensis TaxID=261450 RepID=A0A835I9L1_9MAGN|nr:hypothetical protein IFM89_038659 [Coptis chinensis]
MKQQQHLEDIKVEVPTETKEEDSYKISKLTVRLHIIFAMQVSEEMQKTADIFFYAHLLLGVGVEVFQIFTIGALLKTISPPRN